MPLSGDRRLPAQRRKELQRFEKAAGLRFRKPDLLDRALTHRSRSSENSLPIPNNERLEFLGDSVLGLVVASWLYQELPDRSEGDMAKIKSFVVSRSAWHP
jgi:ribonuclease-3